jgi:cyclopropane fatty-acyl-phospholipid synthase-like methyltransferase
VKKGAFAISPALTSTHFSVVMAINRMGATTPSQLSQYLKSINHAAKGLDKVKIAYRPYICPFSELLETVRNGEKVFDVGCGSGQFALLVGRFAKPAWIGGVDIGDAMIQNAKELFKNSGLNISHTFETFDGKNFPPMIKEADRVFLIDVFHHVPIEQQAVFLTTLHRAMRPGSSLVVKDIDAGSSLVYFNKLHDLVVAKEIGHEVEASQLQRTAEEAGFKVLSKKHQRMFWYPHFTLILSRE